MSDRLNRGLMVACVAFFAAVVFYREGIGPDPIVRLLRGDFVRDQQSADAGAAPLSDPQSYGIDTRTWKAAEKLFFMDPVTAAIKDTPGMYAAWWDRALLKTHDPAYRDKKPAVIALMRAAHDDLVEQGYLPDSREPWERYGNARAQRVGYDPFASVLCEEGFHAVGEVCRKSCPEGQVPVDDWVDACKWDKHYSERGVFGGCPAGYVDHPANPDLCVVPLIAHRMLRPR